MKTIRYSLESEAISYLCNKDKRLSKVIYAIGPLEYTLHSDIYAFLLHEIVEQMLSVKAGNVIYNRLVNLCNSQITPEIISKLDPEQLRAIGMSYKKAHCISELSLAILEGRIDLASLESLSNDEVMKLLTGIRGIGPWTAKMCLIFSLNRLDVLPFEDKAFIQSYRWLYNTNETDSASISKRCKKWSPYTSIAVRYMYRALDLGLTKTKFHLHK